MSADYRHTFLKVLTKRHADCIICIMLSAVKTSSIVFYAAAAGIAFLLAVVFLVAAIRKRRARNGADVLFFIAGTLVLLVALAAGAFALIVRYAPFKLAAVEAGSKLRLLYNGKTLFTVPAIGKAVTVFTDLALIGVIAPFAVAGLALLSLITVGAKTYRRKKHKKEKQPIAAGAESVAPAQKEETFAEADEPAQNADAAPPAPEEQASPREIEPEAANSILDEIDALVDGASVPPIASDVGEQLRRAINEGYALADMPHDAYADAPIGENAEEETDEPRGNDLLAEEPFEEETQEDETTEDEPQDELQEDELQDDETFVRPEIVPERKRVRGDDTVVAVPPESITQERRAPVFGDSAVAAHTRVRTIVRRPAARNLEELTRRAEELEEERGQENAVATEKPKEPSRPPQKATNARKSAGGQRSAAQKSAPVKKEEPATAHKNVTAEENNLPLTRKYIILNRRNAAAVFNEYLNSKRAQEKDELTGSLNTIIMK